jgi:hypothetical protein
MLTKTIRWTSAFSLDQANSTVQWTLELNKALYEVVTAGAPPACQIFLLELIVCYVGREKVTMDTAELVWFWFHC